MTLDLKHLRQIIAISQTGNFAKAAGLLSMSQPALSRSLQTLEQRLGARLFDRDRSGVVPTPTGQILLARAHSLLQQASEVEREVGLLIGRGTGHLRIGAGPYPAAISIGTAVARLITEFPGLSVDVEVGDWDVLTHRVLEAELDLAIVELPPSRHDDRLDVEPLSKHAGTLFCRADHPLTRLALPTLADLGAYPLAMTLLPPRLRHVVMRKRDSTARQRDHERSVPWIHVNTFELARQIVLESDAIGLALPRQIADEVAAGLLAMLAVEVPNLHTNYGIVRLAGRTLSPAAAEFIRVLREVEATVTERGRPGSRGRPRRRAARPA
jgi:DNA-binding transcriptional LysR family regulator